MSNKIPASNFAMTLAANVDNSKLDEGLSADGTQHTTYRSGKQL